MVRARLAFLVGLGLAATLASGQVTKPAAPHRGVLPSVIHDPDDCCPACARVLLAQGAPVHGTQPPGGPGVDGGSLATTDVLHYDLDIEINPTAVTIAGRNIMTVKSLADGLTTFQIRLDPAFASPVISIGGTNLAWVRGVGPIIDITLNRAYNLNEQFDLRVDYAGVPPTGNGFGSIVFTTQNGQPLIHTLSEPYFACTWWPVKEDNTDKATADLAFTVPDTLVVASNGMLQGVDILGGSRKKYRWRTNYQTAPYLFCFSATNYNQYNDVWTWSGGSMRLEYYLYPANDTATNRTAWMRAKDMLTAHSSFYGTYPFTSEKYGIYQFSFGGGMEHQTMTGEGTFNESVTAHELGHQWWGDNVTCGTWSDIWLNEGFADYCEATWFEYSGRNLSPATPGFLALKTAMLARRPSDTNGTVYYFRNDPAWNDTVAMTNDNNRMFSTAFSYRKPGWVLHMLRHQLGDSTFFACLAAYRNQYQYSTAVTADFQNVCQTVSGQDLTTFFNQWIYNVGAPLYSYAWRNVSAAGRNYVEVFVQQTQNAAWPTFVMPIDCVTSAGGPTTTTVVKNDARAEYLLFQVAAPATTFALDPDNWILTSNNTSPNYGKTSVAFVEGPPKIVDVQPAPGVITAIGGPAQVTVTFHRPVNAPSNAFTLTRNGSPVPFTYAYSAGTMTSTLTITGARPPGIYTVGVAATVVASTGGLALDGETTNPNSPASLPTGDGVAGGAATFTFKVPGCSAADIATEGNANPLAGPDGFVTGIDFDVFVQAYFTLLRDSTNALVADLTNGAGSGPPDGFVTGTDFDKFVQVFFAGC